jgi:hypothetical protein
LLISQKYTAFGGALFLIGEVNLNRLSLRPKISFGS